MPEAADSKSDKYEEKYLAVSRPGQNNFALKDLNPAERDKCTPVGIKKNNE
jgi:hypothetical protein